MTLGRTKKGQDAVTALALFLLVLVTLLLVRPREARAAAGEHGAGVGLGQVLLLGDFAKNFTDNLGFHFMYSYEASQMFGLLGTVALSSHSNADGSNTLDMKGFTPALRINLAYVDKLVLYTFLGFGLYQVDEKVGAQQGSVTTLGLAMGGAVNLALDKHFQFGTELSFHNVFGKTDPTTVSSQSPGLSIGGTYIGLFLNLFYIF